MVVGHAALVDLGQHEGRGIGRGHDEAGAHAVLLEPRQQQAPEPVVGDAPQEVDVTAQSGDGPGRVVLSAAGRRGDLPCLVDDEVDEGLAPDDDAGTGCRGERASTAGADADSIYQPSPRRCSAMARAALPRCDRACFSPALIWPTVRPPGGSVAGSKMGS